MPIEQGRHQTEDTATLVERLRRTLEMSELSLEARIALNKRLFSLTHDDQFRLDADNLEVFSHLRGSLPPTESED